MTPNNQVQYLRDLLEVVTAQVASQRKTIRKLHKFVMDTRRRELARERQSELYLGSVKGERNVKLQEKADGSKRAIRWMNRILQIIES